VALRLAEVKRRRPDRLEELSRLAGRAVVIEVETVARAPDEVARIVRDIGAVAVLVDSFRGDLQDLRSAVAPVPVLRPLFERRPGTHAGLPEKQFCGYGRLNEHGDVDALADGALAP
jgi:hypothetical protein